MSRSLQSTDHKPFFAVLRGHSCRKLQQLGSEARQRAAVRRNDLEDFGGDRIRERKGRLHGGHVYAYGPYEANGM